MGFVTEVLNNFIATVEIDYFSFTTKKDAIKEYFSLLNHMLAALWRGVSRRCFGLAAVARS